MLGGLLFGGLQFRSKDIGVSNLGFNYLGVWDLWVSCLGVFDIVFCPPWFACQNPIFRKNYLLNYGTMGMFKMMEFIPIGWWIISFFMFSVKMTKISLLTNPWLSWSTIKLSKKISPNDSFHVKINFSNYCSKVWLWLIHISTSFFTKNDLAVWLGKFLVLVLDNWLPFGLKVYSPHWTCHLSLIIVQFIEL